MEDRVDFSVVIPVYNEEEVLPETYRRMKEVMSSARVAMSSSSLMMEAEIKAKRF